MSGIMLAGYILLAVFLALVLIAVVAACMLSSQVSQERGE